jgi:hypothetical protein
MLLALAFLTVCQVSLKDVASVPMAFRTSILYLLMLLAGIINRSLPLSRDFDLTV